MLQVNTTIFLLWELCVLRIFIYVVKHFGKVFLSRSSFKEFIRSLKIPRRQSSCSVFLLFMSVSFVWMMAFRIVFRNLSNKENSYRFSAVNYFRKTVHRRYLTGFWIWLSHSCFLCYYWLFHSSSQSNISLRITYLALLDSKSILNPFKR